MKAMLEWLWSVLRKPVPVEIFGRVIEPPLIILLLAGLSLLAYQPVKRWWLQDEWRTFTHSRYEFAIDYPAAWSVREHGASGSRGNNYLRAQFNGAGYVLIHEQPLENPELADAVEWGQAIIRRGDGYDLSPLMEIQVGQGNYPALTRTYRRGRTWLVERVRVVYLVTENSAFMIEFSRFDFRYENSEPVFERMLASFRFLEEERPE